MRRLTALSAAGSGDTEIEAFNTPTLKLSLSGSGDVHFDSLGSDDLGIRVSGSGDVSGNGKIGKLTTHTAGTGDVSYSGNAAVISSVAGSGSVTKR